jgi:DNA mismatch repair protein MSH6
LLLPLYLFPPCRYYTPFIKKNLQPLAEAEDTAAVLLRDVLLLLQQKFDAHYEKWVQTVARIAHIDALLSLARASSESST